MNTFFRFFLVLFLSFMAFTAGWFLRGLYPKESEIASYNPDMVRKNKLFHPSQVNIKAKEETKTKEPASNLNLKPLPKEELKISHLISKKKKKPPTPPLIKKEDKYKKQNHQQFLATKGNTFYIKGGYSFLINGFSREQEALKYIEKLKRKFPNWSVFIKQNNSNYLKVYLGPFQNTSKASQFIDELKIPFPFSNYVLVKQGL